MAAIRTDRKCTITLTFPTPENAMQWFEAAQERGVVQEDATLFQMDGLDSMVGDNGPPGSNVLIVRRIGDRPRGRVRRQSEISDRIVVT